MLTQSSLKESLSYDPETGFFTWLWRSNIHESVNLRDAGRIAGNDKQKPDKYVTIGINGESILAHRLAFLYMTGSMPVTVDHIDGNKSNNAWSNLREVTPQQNSFNIGKAKNNTSGHTGVYWDKKNQKWMSLIMVNGKSLFLGRFSILEEAIKARIEAEKEYFGSYRRNVS